MAVTENLYTGDGSTVLFSFTFPYLATTDVKVSLDGSDTTAYSLANATQVQLNTAPASGVAVRVYRSTSDTSLSAEFFPGAAIKSSDLNNNFNQTLYVTQESNALVSDAVTKANSASAAVEGAFFYTPIANVAAIPGSPSTDDRIEIIDSTNVESTSGVNTSSLPTGFTGSSALTIRLEYSSGAWQFKQYFATDPEARYYPKTSGTTNASNIATNTSNISTNTSNISTNTSNISTNTSDIATNASNISTNTSDIATNTSNIATNTSNISTNTSSIRANIRRIRRNIATNTSNISTNTSNISSNTSAISTNTSNISTNTSNISTNTTNIATKMPLAGGTFTGDVSFDGEVIAKGDSTNAGKITLNCEDNDHAVKIKGPAHSAAADYTLTLPDGTGSNGNALVTDGSGNLSWGSPTADVSGKADIDSPTFTGTPAAPTATQGTSTTQLATTAFVNAEIAADTVNLAPKASPTFTGIPAAPTASAGTNTTQVATTQFVATAVNDKAPLVSPSLTGTPTAPTANSGTNTTQIATTAFVDAAVSPKANTASPTLTGTPAAPTAAVDTDTTQIATTAYVKAQIANDAISSVSPAFTGTPTAPTASQGSSTTQLATTAFVNAEIAADTAGLAPTASPTFTGTPTAPTASSGTNNTQLATTAYVDGALSSKADIASPAFTGTPTAPTTTNYDSNGTRLATTAWVNAKIDNASLTYGIQGYDADTTKNDVANTFTAKQTLDDVHIGGAYTAEVIDASSGINCSNGNFFEKEITSGTVTLIGFTNVPTSAGEVYSFTLKLKLNGGAFSSSAWPSSVKWSGGTVPGATLNKTHLFFFVTPDQGTTWYGSAITDFDN